MSEKIIQLNEGAIKQELGELVRQSVEDTLNAMLDEEADRLTNATRYERSEDRLDTRAGHYNSNAGYLFSTTERRTIRNSLGNGRILHVYITATARDTRGLAGHRGRRSCGRRSNMHRRDGRCYNPIGHCRSGSRWRNGVVRWRGDY